MSWCQIAGVQTGCIIGGMIGGWELILVLAVVLILFGARKLPDLVRDIERESGFGRFKKAVPKILKELEKDPRFHQPDYRGESTPIETSMNKSQNDNLIVWIAQGFGVGRIPFAPGTFGSVVGVLWFLLLLATGNFWWFMAGTMVGFPVSVWACGEAEKILKLQDPGSVVMDEIIAIPICFLGWVTTLYARSGRLPSPDYFLSSDIVPWTAAVFAAFRFFDVLKPWPVKQSQLLPGGWGVTVDDVFAAFYVNFVVLMVALVRR